MGLVDELGLDTRKTADEGSELTGGPPILWFTLIRLLCEFCPCVCGLPMGPLPSTACSRPTESVKLGYIEEFFLL